MKPAAITSFQSVIQTFYEQQGRHDLPWRLPEPDGTFDPYKITVSELMLQQTQVGRVIPKYQAFLQTFPTVRQLAAAPLSEVLTLWSGLGYNRRAKFLWQSAQMVVDSFGGVFPRTTAELITLPGIGVNTAGAIMAYAYDKPVIFIETNVRTVYIHHFCKDQTNVPDAELMPLLEATLPAANIRIWYWAVMDYGTYLKQTIGNVSQASSHYAKQSKFEGSRRQIRGHVLRLLTSGPHPLEALTAAVQDDRLSAVLRDLIAEGLIETDRTVYQLRML